MPSLTYAGIPLISDWHHQAQDFVDKFQRIEDLILWAKEGPSRSSWQNNPAGKTRVGEPTIKWPDQPPLRIGQVYWPCTGATRWAYGLFLCTGEQKTEIERQPCRAPYNLISTTATDPPVPGTDGTDDSRCTVRFSMYALAFRRITGVAGAGKPCQHRDGAEPPSTMSLPDHDLWLVVLVDRRWFWQFYDMGGFTPYTTSSDCEEVCTATWASVFSWVTTRLKFTGYAPAAQPAAYELFGPDCKELMRPYDNAAQILEACATSVGKRVVMNYDGTAALHSPAVASLTLRNNVWAMQQQLAGTKCELLKYENANTRTRPNKIRVVYPKLRNGHALCEQDFYVQEVDKGTDCGESGWYKTIHSTSWATYDDECDLTSLPDNYNDLALLTAQIAKDAFDWTKFEYDFTMSSPRPWVPGGYDDHVLFKVVHEETNDFLAATHVDQITDRDHHSETALAEQFRRDHQTRVQSLPINVGSDSQWHGTDATVYPDEVLVEICSCWEPDTSCCDLTEQPNCWPRARATIVRWCDCDWLPSESDEIWVYSATAYPGDDELRGQLQDYFCQEDGSLSSSSAGEYATYCLPIKGGACCDRKWAKWNCESNRYEVVADYDDLWRFELNEELCAGECAEAQLVLHCCDDEADLVTTDITFEVCDALELICDCKLYGAAPTGSSSSSSSGDECTCRTSYGCLPAGTRGVARYWPDKCRWEVLSFQSCEPPMFAYVELAEGVCLDDCETGSSGAGTTGIARTDPESTYYPGCTNWDEPICKVKFTNMPMMACAGDTVFVTRDTTNGDVCWTAINVRDHGTNVVNDLENANCVELEGYEGVICLLRKYVSCIGAHSCDCEEPAPQDVLQMETIDVVVGAGEVTQCDSSSSGADVTCVLPFVTRKVCVITCDDGEPGEAAGWTFESTTVVQYLDDDGECITADVATVFTPCLCNEAVAVEIVCTEPCQDCDTSSSS